MINKETIDKIFETARIEEVVGDFVTLKKRGVNLLGLCPFHNEKTPSFTVSPAKGIYKCFGCGKGGNPVNFVMDHEQLDYPGALRYLAKKYSIPIEEEETDPEQEQSKNERESLYIVSSFAQKYFTDTLHQTDEGKSIGLGYFKERGFRDDIIEKFQLGYSPDAWRALTDTAVKAGYQLEYLVKAGLTVSTEDQKTFDRFAGRVMFPIHNITGRVIAFGGRILKTDKKTAKYINSPETDIYHKSKVLYGLFFAKKAIISGDNCYLVEGYTDVISLHQAGIENVVASSGTSLTVDQIRLIKRYTNNITILYDGDAAGIKASFRGIDLILEEGMHVKVLLFPDGEDPDSFSKKVDSTELRKFLHENTNDFVRFRTSFLVKELKDAKNDPFKKAEFIREVAHTIALIPDAFTRSFYIKDCAAILEIDEQTLINEINKIGRQKVSKKIQEASAADASTGLPPEDPVKETVLTANSAEYQEKDIIRILLNYGTHMVSVDSEDEEGKPVQTEVSVAALILHELEKDGITLEHPTYASILQEFAAGQEKAFVPDEVYFIHHTDKEIAKTTIDLISNPYSLSNWEQHGIYVQTEDLLLKRSALSAVYALKARRIEKMLVENHRQLKAYHTDEELLQLLQQRQLLEEAKKLFSSLLGRIVIK